MKSPSSTKCVLRVVLALAAVAGLSLMIACGSSSPAPNNNGFSNSDLNGTYVFSFFGTDITSGTAYPFAMVGQLAADGQGHFTSGTVDINNPSLAIQLGSSTSLFPAESATGTYSVASDGRATGSITVVITLSTGSTSVPIGLDFVLADSSGGLITRFDTNGSGSGTIDLQSSGLTQSSLQGSYGVSTSGYDFSHFNPFAAAGGFTVSSSGAATGIFDLNSNGNDVPGGTTGLPLLGGSGLVVGPTISTATFVTSSGTLTFDVYPVSSSHLKFIETDSIALTAGDAFTSQTSIAAGAYAYTMEGVDASDDPVAMAGFVTSDGSSVLSNGFEDYNDAGTVNTVTLPNGSFGAFNGGRTEVVLNSFYNGGALLENVQFAGYPTTGGILLLENDNSGITSGTALAQGTVGVATSQGYGLNLSGINSSGEEDDIAQFNVNSSNQYSGLADLNDVAGIGGLSRSVSFTGTLTPDSSISGYGGVTNSSLFNFNYYMANNGETTLILETDNSQVGTGSFLLQQSGVTPAIVGVHFLAVKPTAAAKAAMKKFKNK